LNELVTDALECVPECVEYMKMLKTEEVFRFCAIPQVGPLFALRFVAFLSISEHFFFNATHVHR